MNEVTRERAQSFLTDDHIERIVKAYEAFKDEPGFTRVVGLEEIRAKDGNLSIPLYVSAPDSNGQVQISANGSLPDALSAWLSSASDVRAALATILGTDALKETRAVGGKPAQALPAWIKRDEWKRLPFGEFAQSVNERVEPSQAGDEIYVGLEHLDPQDLHIRRWGKGSDVIGTKLRFRKGDLIFGRRRAYQRKLAVAEFDGICSAHAMVVRAKPDVVLPEFLPFLMMSDRFMNRAVEISVGSLSPTINWTTLKLEEFALPPLDQQRRIAEILWAVDDTVEVWRSTLEDAQRLLMRMVEAYLTRGFTTEQVQQTKYGAIPANWRVARIGDATEEIRERNHTLLLGREDVLSISNQHGFKRNDERIPSVVEFSYRDIRSCEKRSLLITR